MPTPARKNGTKDSVPITIVRRPVLGTMKATKLQNISRDSVTSRDCKYARDSSSLSVARHPDRDSNFRDRPASTILTRDHIPFTHAATMGSRDDNVVGCVSEDRTLQPIA